MSKATGGPAFPCLEATVTGIDSDGQERIDTEAHGGMTLRDYFAGKTLNAILSQDEYGVLAHAAESAHKGNDTWARYWAKEAYAIADAMLAERAK